ncbi:MAG: hypothetical protein LBR96_06185 [Treponema sp.]|jgi:hypothetical protein|nr:hypothetical protein [Treponema sp.]
MKLFSIKIFVFSGIFLCFSAVFSAFAADQRHIPVEVNVIIDSSEYIAPVGEEPVRWLSGHVIDEILKAGDSICIWDAGTQARIIYQGTIKDENAMEEIKKALQSRKIQGKAADFEGALRAAARQSRSGKAQIGYTVLICGSSQPSLTETAARMLRYSKTEIFSGWRAMIAALDIGDRVQQAAAAYGR